MPETARDDDAATKRVSIQKNRRGALHCWGHHVGVLDCGPPNDGPSADHGPAVPREATEEWWNSERAGLRDWFDRTAPHLTPLYLAALRMAMDEDFPGRVHFIAHAIRELVLHLPNAINGTLKLPRLDYEPLVEKVRRRWIADGFPADGSGPSLDERIRPAAGPSQAEVSAEFIDDVARLLERHVTIRRRKATLATPRFETLAGPGPHPPFLFGLWKTTYSDAVKFAHGWDKKLPPTADREWTDNFLAFERFLMVISKRAQDNIADLDELLLEANSR